MIKYLISLLCRNLILRRTMDAVVMNNKSSSNEQSALLVVFIEVPLLGQMGVLVTIKFTNLSLSPFAVVEMG